jgi:putative FmdB family regulatory protein
MPTYDYVCDACHHEFELFQSITAPPERKCPECGRRKLKRLIGTGLGIIFKGSGFYTTDYRSESYKKAAAADKGASGTSSGNASTDGNGKADGSNKKEGSSKKEQTKTGHKNKEK